jgi:hypothetical protein
MLNRFSTYIRQNLLGLVAIFIALTMGTAYATHPGGENTISTEDLQNHAVTQQKIGPQAVTTGKIEPEAVNTLRLRNHAVTQRKIGPQAVTTGKVLDDNLRSEDILDGTIEGIDVAFGTLRGDEIQDGTVSGSDIANDSLTGADIDESSLGQVSSATNADQLGNVPAANYQRRCQAGSITGYARVVGASDYPNFLQPLPAGDRFTCSGSDVRAKRVSTGVYRLWFEGGTPILAVGSVDATSDGGSGVDDFVTVSQHDDFFDGSFRGQLEVNVRDADGGWKDSTFTIVVVK